MIGLFGVIDPVRQSDALLVTAALLTAAGDLALGVESAAAWWVDVAPDVIAGFGGERDLECADAE